MRCYWVQGLDNYENANGDKKDDAHVGTLDEARALVKGEENVFRASVTVTECEIGADKENLLRLVNNLGGTHEFLRKWKGTARGGLREVTEVEAAS